MAPTFDDVTIVGDNKDSNKMAAVDEEDSALLEIMSELSGTLNATETNQPQVPKTKWQRKRKRTATCDVTLDESILQQIECNEADKGKQNSCSFIKENSITVTCIYRSNFYMNFIVTDVKTANRSVSSLTDVTQSEQDVEKSGQQSVVTSPMKLDLSQNRYPL